MYNFTIKEKGKNYKFMDLRERKKKIILTTGNTSCFNKHDSVARRYKDVPLIVRIIYFVCVCVHSLAVIILLSAIVIS